MKTAKEMFEELDSKRKQIYKLRDEELVDTLKYRLASVERVLGHMNDLSWKSQEIPQYLITHCLNKLHGNIDGTELRWGE